MSKKHKFKAEIQQLLDIVVHSLYTDKEIFIRELVSNAADALEKLRFLQTSGQTVHQPDLELKITITLDEKENTITIADTGVGMTEKEMVDNLGKIAHSGSKAFLQQLAEAKKTDATLIGQFGVGFYSAFMVAKKVEVCSRSCQPEAEGCRWVSEGGGSYETEAVAGLPRGTKVVVHLTEDSKEFSNQFTVEQILKRYSSFVPFPIQIGEQTINTVQAIWTRNKSEIKDQEYKEFYQYIGHAHDEPRYRLHFSADAPLAIQALLFVPQNNLEKMGLTRLDPGVNLHCKKILIQAQAKDLLPEWLRFLKGVVDSEDLPLNISRETMQDSALVRKLSQVITKRFLKFLAEEAKKDPDQYNEFFEEFGRFIKEGIVTDFAHKDDLAKLVRYESSNMEKGKLTSLEEYVGRMASDQKEIYFMLAPSRASLESSPYYEVFKAKNYEVLFLYDPWDEFVMEHLNEFDGKKLVSAEKADLKIEDVPKKEGQEELSKEDADVLADWLKKTLGDDVDEVKVSERLVDSPCVLQDKDQFTVTMRQMMKQMGSAAPPGKYALEINPRHPIMVRLNKIRFDDEPLAQKVAAQILDNARAAAGLLDDPRAMVGRLNQLLEQVLKK